MVYSKKDKFRLIVNFEIEYQSPIIITDKMSKQIDENTLKVMNENFNQKVTELGNNFKLQINSEVISIIKKQL